MLFGEHESCVQPVRSFASNSHANDAGHLVRHSAGAEQCADARPAGRRLAGQHHTLGARRVHEYGWDFATESAGNASDSTVLTDTPNGQTFLAAVQSLTPSANVARCGGAGLNGLNMALDRANINGIIVVFLTDPQPKLDPNVATVEQLMQKALRKHVQVTSAEKRFRIVSDQLRTHAAIRLRHAAERRSDAIGQVLAGTGVPNEENVRRQG